MTVTSNGYFGKTVCVYCGNECVPAPTDRYWVEIGHSLGIHYDCVEQLHSLINHKPAPALAKVESENIDELIAEFEECAGFIREFEAMYEEPAPIGACLKYERAKAALRKAYEMEER